MSHQYTQYFLRDVFWQIWDGDFFVSVITWNYPINAIFVQSLSYHMNFDLNWGKWCLQLFTCCFGFYCALLHELSVHSWCHFSTPILGRCTNAPSFLYFCIKVLKTLVSNRYLVNTGPTTKPIPTLVTCQGSRPYKWGEQWVMTYEMNHH